jgi:HK97 family phage prohead protease
MPFNFFTAAVEFKAIEHAEAGSFSGYATIFGIEDAHGDVVAPGAFDGSMAAHKARGTMPGMFVERSRYVIGGDPLPIGVWTKMEPDARGLRVEGRLIPLTTNHIRRIHSLLKDGALRGLSIAYNVPPGDASLRLRRILSWIAAHCDHLECLAIKGRERT